MFLLTSIAVLFLGVQQGKADGGGIIPNHYIVVLKGSITHPANVAGAQADETGSEVGFVYRSALKGYSATMSKADAKALESDPRVKYVTPDRTLGIEAQTTPTGVERIFALTDPSLDIDQTDDVRVNANVAVIDTGVDYTHTDLNVVGRTNCVPAGEDPEIEWEIEQCVGGSGTDGNGHGSHVAGTIGALDNGFGVVGVAPGARLWSVRVLNNNGSGSFAWLIAGVDWVTATRKDANSENDIDVANVSIGCNTLPCEVPPLDEAFTKSAEAGVVYAVGAGNEGGDAGESTFGTSPAVITVSALADYDGRPGGKGSPTCGEPGADDTLASFSNYGKDVEVAAPGVCIYSTYKNGGYATISGTSMASPHVAGAAAILAGKSHPKSLKDVEAIRAQIIANGNQEWNDVSGDGTQEALLDVGRITTGTPTIGSETEATVRGRVRPAGQVATYRFEYGTSTAYGTNIPIPDANIGSGSSYVALSQTLKSLKGKTTYHYRITATIGGAAFYGADRTFGTTKPKATTEAASKVGVNDAVLNGTVNPEGVETTYYFEYGTTAAYGHYAPAASPQAPEPQEAGSGTANLSVSVPRAALMADQTYHFRVVAQNIAGTTYGADREFTTGPAEWKNETPESLAEVERLTSVSCLELNVCTSVGYSEGIDHPILGRWDGTGWLVSSLPGANGAAQTQPEDISCSSRQWCAMVGHSAALPELGFSAMAATWDGEAWEYDSLPAPSEAVHTALRRVSCVSANFCMAVGISEVPYAKSSNGLTSHMYAERWDGTKWSVEDLNPPGAVESFLNSVSCSQTDFCVAVGLYRLSDSQYHAYSVAWNGKGWSPIQDEVVAPEGNFRHVACVTTVDCVGVSDSDDKVWKTGHWNGETWSFDFVPVPGGTDFYILGIDCPSHNSCTAVGVLHADDNSILVVYSWDGTSWKRRTTDQPVSESGEAVGPAELTDVSCISPSHCIASGTAYQSSITLPLIESYQAPGPFSRTNAATNITSTHATLHATVNPQGLKTTYWLEFGKTKAYEEGPLSPPEEIGSGSADVERETEIWPEPGGTYHYRVVASNSEGTTYGEDRTFTLKPQVPVYASTFGVYGTAEGQLNEPLGIALDASGNIWVADSENNRVEKFDQSGKLLLQFGSKGSGNGQFSKPYALSLDSAGNVWVADTSNSRIQKFNSKGEYLAKYGSEGSGNGQFNRPYGLSFDSAGNLWVADSWNSRIQKFNSKGEYLAQFKTSASPTDVAIDAAGRAWVAEYAFNRIRKYSAEGTQLLQVGGTKGTEPGQFNEPTGIAIDSDGRIWVADSENDRIQKFEPSGEFKASIGKAGSGAGQMNFPRDVVFDSAGNLWVVDSSNSRIQKWSYPKQPKATTEAATGATASQATLNGTVNPEGSATGYYFEYGRTTAYSGRIPVSTDVSAGSGTGNVAAGQTLSGLAPETTYHFRLVADSVGGTSHGGDKTFTTPKVKVPKATTEAATAVKATEATLKGTVNPEGSATNYWFEYGTTTSYGTKLPTSPASVGSGTSNVAVTQTPTGLTKGTTYHFRVVAESAGGTVKGEDKTLTTLKLPKATTEAPSVKGTEVTFNGIVNPEGSATNYWFEYGTTTSYGTKLPTSPASVGSGTSNVAVSQAAAGLFEGTTYHYRVVASSEAGTANGLDKTFTTPTVTPARLSGMALTDPFNATTSVVSNFSTNWSALGWASGSPAAGLNRTTGWGPQASYPTVNGAYFAPTVSDAGTGVGAVATMATNPGNPSRYFSLWLDMSSPGGSRSGYELQFNNTATNTYEVKLSKWVSGSQTVLATKTGYSFVNGNSLAITDLGGTVAAWTNTGSGFVQLLSAADSSLAGGNAGVEGSGNVTRLTNFKVGQLLTPVANMNAALSGIPVNAGFAGSESPLSFGGAFAALAWDNSASGHNTGQVSSGWGPYDGYPTVNGAYWQKTSSADTGAGDGVAATLAKNPASTSHYFSLWLNMPNPGSVRSGYQLQFTETSSGVYTVTLAKWSSGTQTVLASKTSYSFATGSQFALVDKLGTVSAWTKTGSEFTQLLSAGDSSYTGGYTGIEGSGNVTRLNNFKAAPLAPF